MRERSEPVRPVPATHKGHVAKAPAVEQPAAKIEADPPKREPLSSPVSQAGRVRASIARPRTLADIVAQGQGSKKG